MQGKVSEKKNGPPQEAAGSFKRTATSKVPNDVGKIISNIPVKPPAITAIKAKPKGAKYFKQPSHQHPLSDHSFLSQGNTWFILFIHS